MQNVVNGIVTPHEEGFRVIDFYLEPGNPTVEMRTRIPSVPNRWEGKSGRGRREGKNHGTGICPEEGAGGNSLG